MSANVMCPHCGMLFQPCELISLHTHRGETCPGVGQIPRCAESDRSEAKKAAARGSEC